MPPPDLLAAARELRAVIDANAVRAAGHPGPVLKWGSITLRDPERGDLVYP